MSDLLKVIFPNLGKEVEIEKGSKIAEACAMAGEPLNQVCGGKGKCGKCAVEIKRQDGKEETVLGCIEEVSDQLQVLIAGNESKDQILTTNMIKDIEPNPSLKSYVLKGEDLKTPLAESDWEHIVDRLNLDLEKPSLGLLQNLSQIYHESDGIEFIIYENKMIDLLPHEEDLPLYGIAFDVGTTSVVGHLYDLKTYEQVGISSTLNKQTSIGGDVISRIDYAEDKKGLKRLNDLIIETINQVIDDICNTYSVDRNRIYQANFCGNSTMQHLLLGFNPTYLGKIPFTSTLGRSIYTNAKELKIKINPKGTITTLPILGGHVGGDTSAVLLSLNQDGKKRLIIDLGTNGEVGVGSNTEFKVSSMASGPALEGYGLEHGMRGTDGAIERVTITGDDLYYKVIGDAKPQGICGSGIIDLIAELLRFDVIQETGAFADASDIELPKLADRLTVGETGKAFIVAYAEETENGNPILLTQKDVRQIQLAKAAIYTGCTMLVEESGIKGEDLSEILMAGAFGNYINIEKAQYMGLIPDFDGVPVYSIGNAAATGSQLFLLSRDEQAVCEKMAENAVHIEIATNKSFNDNFINNLNMFKIEKY